MRDRDTAGGAGALTLPVSLPDFGIKLSKSETSDFEAIQYPRQLLDRPIKSGEGDDSAEAG
jgi:hypothetical protein